MNTNMQSELPVGPEKAQAKARKLVSRADLREWSKLSDRKALLALGFDFGSWALAIAAAEYLQSPVVLVLAIIWIGSRIHALGVLGHEAAHYMLFKNRRLNDGVGHVLAGLIFQSFDHYRSYHFAHHRHLGEDGDGEKCGWSELPKSRKERLQLLFIAVSGIKILFLPLILGQAVIALVKRRSAVSLLILMALAGVIAGLVAFPIAAKLLLLYWVIPGVTWASGSSQLRNIAEHCFLNSEHPFRQSWTVYASPIARQLVSPHGVNFHQAHHLFPSVPFYNLGKLNAQMLKDKEYSESHAQAPGYWPLLKDMLLYETRDLYKYGNYPEEPLHKAG